MEKTLVFTHRLDMALRLVDTTSGWNISGHKISVFADGEQVRFSEKGDHMLIFQNLGKRAFHMKITSPDYEPVEREVDLDTMSSGVPLLEVHLIPGRNFPGGTEFLEMEGLLPGIRELSAVRLGDNACLIREFDSRRRMVTVFNPHRLALDRVQYAVVDPDRGMFEPFQIQRQVNDQTLKIDRLLEMPFKNYFPITPEVFGVTRPDGSYCLRLRDDAKDARWLIRWVTDGDPQFRMVDFRKTERLKLEEGGG